MKKVILCAGALMFGAVGFAQVDEGSHQAPKADQVSKLPGAAANANTGESVQNGNEQKVRVRQAGTKQSVYTLQANGSGTGANQADVMQTGNVSGDSGVRNDAEAIQYGTSNDATILQRGDRNNALSQQGLNNDASNDNKSLIIQGAAGAQKAEGNFAAVQQDGSENQARTRQTYDNNDAWTIQNGERNESNIRQIANPNDSKGHEAYVRQNGNDNLSRVKQEGADATAGARNYAEAVQDGNNNLASQHQKATAANGNANKAIVKQGVGTPIATDITFINDIRNDLGGVDDITNTGAPSLSYNGVAHQYQEGDDNETGISQFGADSPTERNYAEQNQNGDDNDAYIIQNAYGSSTGGGNYAKQDQDGDFNIAGIGQNGMGHKALQVQDGNRNSALSTQRGNSNKVYTNQQGNMSAVETAQRGQNNKIVVAQHNGQSYSVSQNLPGDPGFGMPFGNNQADIIQMGPDGVFPDFNLECEWGELDDPTFNDIGDLSLPGVCSDCN